MFFFVPCLCSVYYFLRFFLLSQVGSGVNPRILIFLFFVFVCSRIPYFCFDYLIFLCCLFVVFGCFFSFLLVRVFVDCIGFVISFMPVGTPYFIGFLVFFTEVVSYVVRPVIMMARPILNLFMGYGLGVLFSLCMLSLPVVGLLYWSSYVVYFFCYEVFIAVLQWSVVCFLLSFSENH